MTGPLKKSICGLRGSRPLRESSRDVRWTIPSFLSTAPQRIARAVASCREREDSRALGGGGPQQQRQRPRRTGMKICLLFSDSDNKNPKNNKNQNNNKNPKTQRNRKTPKNQNPKITAATGTKITATATTAIAVIFGF